MKNVRVDAHALLTTRSISCSSAPSRYNKMNVLVIFCYPVLRDARATTHSNSPTTVSVSEYGVYHAAHHAAYHTAYHAAYKDTCSYLA